ncbi:putative dolichyl-diphosphooligosaccharide--protein glycosyltransferase subunit 3B [Datura stramonium]|uniref:Dolichyl-diphosphooligosaccharide--protein glycosyltransferase subunit 3B n=1 Tax=Datura stramonium TaxID=4076 RepID=A0ABS8RWC9_DATST|nr:putative dolichyl-diphosphooligosaccharide--protein glycosyltransferase subunit 3B [Datura stramonium]
MAISKTLIPTCLFLIAIILLLVPSNYSFSSSSSSDDLLSELTSLRSQSPTGVIHLSDQLLRRIISVKSPRPFTFVIFFDAKQLHSKPELSLPTLKNEFSLLSSSFLTNNPENNKIFFFSIEFQESQASFALFGVNSLPHLRLIPPSAADLKKDSIQMDGSDLARLAESMAEFVEAKTKLTVGPIHRPPMISKKQMALIVAAGLILSPFLVKKILSGGTLLHDKHVWMAGSIFVYFFSVSGAMHNIIRKMPMFMMDREDPGKLVFFYQGSGMQLGAEGFAVGFLYTIVGLLLAFMTHVLVRLKSRTVQRVVMLFALFVSFWAVKKVIQLDNWKTGYGIHAYWPSSWK